MDTSMTPLPEGWTVEEEEQLEPQEQPKVPEGWTVEEEPKSTYRDVVSEELRSQGVEPDFSEELERAAERGFDPIAYAKSLLSGASLGYSEKIPGLEAASGFDTPEGIVSEGFKLIGSTLPISRLMKMFGAPLVNLASKSPILAKPLTDLASITGAGLTGAATTALEEGAKGHELTADDLLVHGATWSLLDAGLKGLGLLGSFGSKLLNLAKKEGKHTYQTLNQIIEDARASGKDISTAEKLAGVAEESLNNRIEKVEGARQVPVTKESLQEQQKKATELANPNLDAAKPFEEEAQGLVRQIVIEDLDAVEPRVSTRGDLGDQIIESVENARVAEREEYAPLYTEAKEASETLLHTPRDAVREASDALLELESLQTRPPGYEKVRTVLEDALADMGYRVQRNPETDMIEFILQERPVELRHSISLAERINEIVDYESLDRLVTDRLKPVNRALKQDIRQGFGSNVDARTAFDLAENEHARVAEKYGTKAMRKVRASDSGETVANMTKSSNTVRELKAALPEEEFRKVQREILEDIADASEGKAKKILREMRPHLDRDFIDAAERVIESKKITPKNISRAQNIQEAIREDLNQAITLGNRPNKALEMWRTEKGQKFVKEALKNHPHKAEIEKYLAEQSYQDSLEGIIKKATKKEKVDFHMFSELIKDPAMRNNIQLLAGPEGVQFFKELESRVDTITKKLDLINKAKTSYVSKEAMKGSKEYGTRILQRMANKDYALKVKLDTFLNSLGLNGKIAVSVLGALKYGPLFLLKTALAKNVLNKILMKKNIRDRLIAASRKSLPPGAFILAFEKLIDELSKE